MSKIRKIEDMNKTPGAFLHVNQMMIYHMQGINPWFYHKENPFELMRYLDNIERAKNAI